MANRVPFDRFVAAFGAVAAVVVCYSYPQLVASNIAAYVAASKRAVQFSVDYRKTRLLVAVVVGGLVVVVVAVAFGRIIVDRICYCLY